MLRCARIWSSNGPRVATSQIDRIRPRCALPLDARGKLLGRIAEVEEIARLVAYLAADLAHFVNGTMIEIDGGRQKPLTDRFRER